MLKQEYVIMILLNMSVEYLLFVGTLRFLGYPVCKWRIMLASAFSGIYCGMSVLLDSAFLQSCLGRAFCICIVCFVAFGFRNNSGLKSSVYVVLNMAYIGAAQIIPRVGVLPPVILMGLLAFICNYWPGKIKTQNEFSTLEINYLGRCFYLEVFRDTGNKLIDPVSGEGIIVIGPAVSSYLTGLSIDELKNPIDTLETNKIRGLRLIPFSSLGNSRDMMLGIRFNDVKLNGRSGSIVAGLAAEGIGDYEALIGGNYVL